MNVGNVGNVDFPELPKDDEALVRFLELTKGRKSGYVKAGRRLLGWVAEKKPELSAFERFGEVDLLKERFALLSAPKPKGDGFLPETINYHAKGMKSIAKELLDDPRLTAFKDQLENVRNVFGQIVRNETTPLVDKYNREDKCARGEKLVDLTLVSKFLTATRPRFLDELQRLEKHVAEKGHFICSERGKVPQNMSVALAFVCKWFAMFVVSVGKRPCVAAGMTLAEYENSCTATNTRQGLRAVKVAKHKTGKNRCATFGIPEGDYDLWDRYHVVRLPATKQNSSCFA